MDLAGNVERAIRAALEAHAGQFRRGTETPYAVHPLQVALELGRLRVDSAVVQAGVLHDVVEDCPEWTNERLQQEFGPRVASIVAEITEDKSKSWRDRKEHGIQSVARLSEDALLVKACDKLHNLQSLVRSLETAENCAEVWGRFKGGREGTLDTSKRLVEALVARAPAALASELANAIGRLAEF